MLFLILLSARILGELFAKIGIPSVLGELSAGILLGISGFGIIEVNDVLKVLAEIGIILLLFEVGIETDVARLKEAGSKAMIVAFFGVFFPFTAAFLASLYLFDFTVAISLFVGGTLTATSIGITLRVLKDIHKEQTNIAQIVIGAAVIDDIFGVIILVFVYDFAVTGEMSISNTLRVSSYIFAFLLLAPAVANVLSDIVRRLHGQGQVPGFIPTIIISLILLFAYLSHLSGAPEILGSFAAGLALSRRFFLPFGLGLKKNEEFIDKVKLSMTPIIQLFTPIFFVMVGLSMNIKVIDFASIEFWSMGIVFLIIAVLGKYLGAYFITQKCYANKMLIGISMIPRGEVGLIFAEIGRLNGILTNEIYAVLIFVIVITTIVPPFLLKWLFKFECA
jgi:Kef-type K+ transport system membrane component KefB